MYFHIENSLRKSNKEHRQHLHSHAQHKYTTVIDVKMQLDSCRRMDTWGQWKISKFKKVFRRHSQGHQSRFVIPGADLVHGYSNRIVTRIWFFFFVFILYIVEHSWMIIKQNIFSPSYQRIFSSRNQWRSARCDCPVRRRSSDWD